MGISTANNMEQEVLTQVTAPERVLVKEVNWLGDLVMSLPALKAVRGAYPSSHLSVMVKRELAGFFEGARWIDELITYSVRSGVKGLNDRRRLIEEIRKRNFGVCVLFPNSFDSALWPTMARVPIRAGFSRDCRGFMLTNRVKPAPDILECHQVFYYLRMLKDTLGIDGNPAAFDLDVSAPAKERMSGFLKEKRKNTSGPLIGLAASAAYGPAKEWPIDSFASLVDILAEKYNAECVLMGAPNERKRAEEIIQKSKAGGVIAAGETSIGDAIALLSMCQGFAGNDSGSMHVAGALNIPTVGIFGSTDPDKTSPLGAKTKVLQESIHCSPCLERTCKYKTYECLTKIKPEMVAGALENLEAYSFKPN